MILKGLGASKGQTSGKICVVKSLTDINKFTKGRILVTKMTNPSYLPIMSISAAVITEEGGILSHAAIVSRELKIPCIVGVKEATKKLKDNDFVKIDANAGTISKN